MTSLEAHMQVLEDKNAIRELTVKLILYHFRR